MMVVGLMRLLSALTMLSCILAVPPHRGGAKEVIGTGGPSPCTKPVHLVIFGAPGSGKGTACSIIRKKFGLVHISTGDLCRERATRGDDQADILQSIISSGALVSDDLIFDLLREKLTNNPECLQKGFILDGFPRTLEQLNMLNKLLEELGIGINLAIELEAPLELIFERIAGRLVHPASGRTYHCKFKPPKVPMVDDETGEPLVVRSDDNEETLGARLKEYREKSCPLVSWYKEKGALVRVDTTNDSPAGYIAVLDKINNLIYQ